VSLAAPLERRRPLLSGRRRTTLTASIAVAFTIALVAVLFSRRHEFVAAVETAPIWMLALTACLQAVALVSRSEAWLVCVSAAGGTVSRRRLYRASSMGSLASVLSSQLATAARIAVLRRTNAADSPRVPALIAAETPIIAVEAALAALTSFTLVGPLGLPLWLPFLCILVTGGILLALRRLAGRRRQGFCSGLAVLRSTRGRARVVGFVLVAVFAQILRNWLMLRTLGVDASIFDAIAVLIAMVTFSQLPIGPGVGAAAVVMILGANGLAITAAAGVLLTVTGTIGALGFAAWAGVDHVVRFRRTPALS
jgi:uncharacterized membrane protein YbhN (UPF0104 family)